MKIVLCALNAKFIHTNLAVRSIKKYCESFYPTIKEYTINDSIDSIIASLYKEKADVIAFSCYIWNIDRILYISKTLKSVCPSLKIILGGHEVTYDARDILLNNNYIDFIVRGEGEKPCYMLFDALLNNTDFSFVPSLSYRKDAQIIENEILEESDINEYPFPYESIEDCKSKIIYYESSRGCPFGCTYCLSGRNNKVRYLELERVKKELMFFITNNVPLVKFVDRTFNADKKRACEIFKFIIENNKNTTFHFELSGSLIDDEMIDILKGAKKGHIQFEIGVQSTNKETLKAIGRNIDFDKIKENVRKLINLSNIHIHLDLIAGLPYENYESFKRSFDDVISLFPNVLQLGFLKMLKGSKIRNEASKFNYKFKTQAPYEVIENDFISFDEIIKLKYIEDLLEKYYNSGDFKRSMEFLFKKYQSPFEVFERIYDFYLENNLLDAALSLEKRQEILVKVFGKDDVEDYAKADLLTNKKAKISYDLDPRFKDECFCFLKNEANVKKYLPKYIKLPPKIIYKKLRFEQLFGGVYMFDKLSEELICVTCDFKRK